MSANNYVVSLKVRDLMSGPIRLEPLIKDLLLIKGLPPINSVNAFELPLLCSCFMVSSSNDVLIIIKVLFNLCPLLCLAQGRMVGWSPTHPIPNY